MEACLNRCIDSIIKQSFVDLEIILVDDGSTDGSLQICENYAKENDRIIVVKKENGGLSSARLAGFDLARGKYILFIDSDDYIHADMVRWLVDSIETYQSDLAICEYYKKRGENEKPMSLPYENNIIQGRKNIIDSYVKPLIGSIDKEAKLPGFICIRLMKRELIQREFFMSEKEYFMEDHVFDLLYADCVQTISIVHKPLYYYCVNQSSLTNRHRENKWEMFLKLYDFYLSYVRKRNMTNCQKRLESFLLFAFCASVDNAILSGSYKTFKLELKKITQSRIPQTLNASMFSPTIPVTYRITLLLYRAHMFFVLYCLRKARLQQM